MGRARKPGHSWMPPRVYLGKSAYEYHPRGGGAIRLCKLDAPRSVVWARYEEATRAQDPSSVTALFDDYFDSPHFKKKLAVDTQKNYRKYRAPLERVFGRMRAGAVKPKHVRKYMDKRGEVSERLANRELQFFSAVFSWGFERGWVSANPGKGVRKFTERPRTVYVEDEWYWATYNACPVMGKAAMEIAYICGSPREKDILDLTEFDSKDEGLYISMGKTGVKQIKAWTPRLKSAVEMALEAEPRRPGGHIIRTRSGGRYTRDGFHSMFYRAQVKAGTAGKFNFHDIKSKSTTDYKGDRKRFTGHKTERQVATYVVKPDVVDSLEKDGY